MASEAHGRGVESEQSTLSQDAREVMDSGLLLQPPPAPGHLDLFHRTSSARAEQAIESGGWSPFADVQELVCSSHPDGQGDGHGDAVLRLQVPAELAALKTGYGDRVRDYRVSVQDLREEHLMAGWDTENLASTDPKRPGMIDGRVGATVTWALPPVALEPPQVDLDLGEAVYRQAAARGGFTPESTAAAEVTIEQAVTNRQAVSTADRLHALAAQVETARDHRATQPAAAPPVRPVPVAPPPRAETARARAASAQIWDDTRDEYDAPTVAERR